MIGPRALPKHGAAVFVLLFVSLVVFVMTGCVREGDLTLEQRSHQLNSQLMCPVCDGQTIDGSNAQISQDMRAKVRELLEEGNSNSDIKDYFVLRYGQEILASPEGDGFNLLAWIVPFFIVGGGIGIAVLTIRSLRRANTAASSAVIPPMSSGHTVSSVARGKTDEAGDLSIYLAQVDRDLGIPTRSSASHSEPRSDSMPPAVKSEVEPQ